MSSSETLWESLKEFYLSLPEHDNDRKIIAVIDHLSCKEYSKSFFPGTSLGSLLISSNDYASNKGLSPFISVSALTDTTYRIEYWKKSGEKDKEATRTGNLDESLVLLDALLLRLDHESKS